MVWLITLKVVQLHLACSVPLLLATFPCLTATKIHWCRKDVDSGAILRLISEASSYCLLLVGPTYLMYHDVIITHYYHYWWGADVLQWLTSHSLLLLLMSRYYYYCKLLKLLMSWCVMMINKPFIIIIII